MRYKSAKGFRAALEERLKSQAIEDQIEVGRLRKRVTFERFLARLHTVAPDQWFLKGGFALELRLGNVSRTTKDIDVDWSLPEDEAVETLLDAANADLGDFFS